MTKAVVFDLGGTLMEYKGMPLNWDEYYYSGFQNVNKLNELSLSEEEILDATKILKDYMLIIGTNLFKVLPASSISDPAQNLITTS